MPLERCGDDGWRWGTQGKCYSGPDGKKKAIRQAIAIGEGKMLKEAIEKGAIPESAHYGPAETPDKACISCNYYVEGFSGTSGVCSMFDALVGERMLCNKWEAAPVPTPFDGAKDGPTSKKKQPQPQSTKKQDDTAGFVRMSPEDAIMVAQAINNMHHIPVHKEDEESCVDLKSLDPEAVKLAAAWWASHPQWLAIQENDHELDPRESLMEFWSEELAEPEHRLSGATAIASGFVLTVEAEQQWEEEMAKKIKLSKAAPGILYLVSHTHTLYNRPGKAHDRVQGWKDIPLTAAGKVEARKLGKFLRDKGITTLYSSNLKRAEQTADLIGKVIDLPVQTSSNYRPWNLGNFAGDSSKNVIPKLEEFLDDPTKVVPGGESFNSFKERFLPAFEKLLKLAEGGATIALVTHSRNLEFAEGWLGGNRKKLDEDEIGHILSDAVNPGVVVEVAQKRGKFRMRVVGPSEIAKAMAKPAELRLMVVGVSKSPDGQSIYRMGSRDGRYVGRTNATKYRALKGDVLKVQANDFRINAGGDFQWQNPNVVSHYSDRAYSFKHLEALAGGELVKDGAPGPAGDIPAAGDEGDSHMPSGPTLDSVHIPAPLPNISVAYANRRLIGQKIKVVKADQMQQLVYGVVLEPNSMDSQDDYMLPHHVEKAAHTYLKKAIRGQSSVAKLQHRAQGFRKDKPSIVPVESFVAPVDFSYDGKEMIKKGTWVMAMHVEDPILWDKFMDGTYTGFSVGGTGIRQSMHQGDPDVPHGYITPPGPQSWHPDPHDMSLVAESS